MEREFQFKIFRWKFCRLRVLKQATSIVTQLIISSYTNWWDWAVWISGNTAAFYSESAGFESQPGHWLSWMRVFRDFPNSLQVNVGIVLRSGNDCLLPNTFKLINVHSSSDTTETYKNIIFFQITRCSFRARKNKRFWKSSKLIQWRKICIHKKQHNQWMESQTPETNFKILSNRNTAVCVVLKNRWPNFVIE